MSRVRSAQLFPALFLILFGALLLANNLGWFIFRWEQLWAIIFIALGVWLVWRGLYPRQTESRDEMLWGFGEYAPDLANKTIQHESFRHGFGEMDLDFTRANFPDGENAVRASLGFGEIKIKLPRELAVQVSARAGFGQARVFDDESAGIAPTVDYQTNDYATASRKLSVRASVGFGEVKIVR